MAWLGECGTKRVGRMSQEGVGRLLLSNFLRRMPNQFADDVAHHTSQTIHRVPPRLALHQLQQARQAVQIKLPVVFDQQIYRHVLEFALGQIPQGLGQHQQFGGSPSVQPAQAT